VTIVSNASPLIGIARIDKLDLLRQLYGELIIPEAVWHEVVVRGIGQPGAELMRNGPCAGEGLDSHREIAVDLRLEVTLDGFLLRARDEDANSSAETRHRNWTKRWMICLLRWN